MNKLDYTGVDNKLGYPFTIDDIRFMLGTTTNKGIYKSIDSVAASLGNNRVLSGCVVTGIAVNYYKITSGWIVLDGEVLYVPQHDNIYSTTGNIYFKKNITIPPTNGNKKYKLDNQATSNIYVTNQATTGSTYNVSTSPLQIMKNGIKIDNYITINDGLGNTTINSNGNITINSNISTTINSSGFTINDIGNTKIKSKNLTLSGDTLLLSSQEYTTNYLNIGVVNLIYAGVTDIIRCNNNLTDFDYSHLSATIISKPNSGVRIITLHGYITRLNSDFVCMQNSTVFLQIQSDYKPDTPTSFVASFSKASTTTTESYKLEKDGGSGSHYIWYQSDKSVTGFATHFRQNFVLVSKDFSDYSHTLLIMPDKNESGVNNPTNVKIYQDSKIYLDGMTWEY